MVTPEFGTSKDPLKALLTRIPKGVFRWVKRAWRRRCPPLFHHNREWSPVLQADHHHHDDDDDEHEGVRLEEALPPVGAGVGVDGGPGDFEQPEEDEEGGEGGGARGVVIKGLRKEFGSKVAVAGLDLRLRVGDITCLLGHNGAGECFFFFICFAVAVTYSMYRTIYRTAVYMALPGTG